MPTDYTPTPHQQTSDWVVTGAAPGLLVVVLAEMHIKGLSLGAPALHYSRPFPRVPASSRSMPTGRSLPLATQGTPSGSQLRSTTQDLVLLLQQRQSV